MENEITEQAKEKWRKSQYFLHSTESYVAQYSSIQ